MKKTNSANAAKVSIFSRLKYLIQKFVEFVEFGMTAFFVFFIQFAWQTFMCFSVWPLLFEATMPRRYARSDVRDSDTTSVDIQNHYPALKLRVSMSTSLVQRVAARFRMAIDGTDFSVF